MAEWKKVVVSGSGVAQLSNDANYLIDAQDSAILTGSFTGSFTGDGSGLTGVTADGTVSGSAQITVQDTTGFSDLQANISASFAVSSSAHTQREAIVSNLSSSAHTQREAVVSSLSSSAHTQRESVISTLSSSAHTQREAQQTAQDNRLDAIETFTGSLDDTFATDAELASATSSLSSSAHTARRDEISALSSSAHTQRISEDSVLSGSAHTRREEISASLASSIQGVSAGALTSGSFEVALNSETGSLEFTDGQEIGDKYVRGNGAMDLYVPSGASWIELNYGGQDYIYLDGRKAGIQLENDGTTLEWTFYGSGENSGILNAPGDIIIPSNKEFNGGKVNVATVTGSANFNTLHNKPTLVSGSGQVDITNTDGYSTFSSSIATYTDGKVSDVSGSAHTARRSEISDLSGSAHTQRNAEINTLSASVDAHLDANINTVSSSAHTARRSEISDLSGSAHTQRTNEITTLSASVDAHLDANINSISASAHTARRDEINDLSESVAQAQSDSNSDVTDLIASQSAIDTALSFSGTDVTVNGDLTVSGTTTSINSNTIELGDNILELNGTGSNFAGLKVNDNNGPASGSLLWDGVNNYWTAGAEGSESKVLLSDGDNVISGSVQVTIEDTDGFSGLQGNISASFAGSASAHTARRDEISDLSGSSHTARRSEIGDLSGSVHTARRDEISDLSASVDTHLDANISTLSGSAHTARRSEISDLSGSAHTQREAVVNNLSASAHTARALSANSASAHTQREAVVSNLSGSAHTARRSEISDLSGSAHTDRVAKVNVLSGSAHTDRIAKVNVLSGSAHTDRIAKVNVLSGSAHTQRVAAIATLSASAHAQRISEDSILSASAHTARANLASSLTISGSTGDDIVNLKTDSLTFAGEGGVAINVTDNTVTIDTTDILSGSDQVVDSLLNQDVDLGTGDITGVSASFDFITGSAFSGDGSGLSNITVTQNATVEDTFTNVTTKTTTHNFNSKNIIVQVYDDNDLQIIPEDIDTSNVNQAVITFSSNTTGRVVVARGGHIVSGSIPFANLIAVPTLVSGSEQVTVQDTDGFTELQSNISASFAVSSSAHTQREAVTTALSASAHAQRISEDTVLSGSAHTARRNEISDLSGSAHTARASLASSLTISGSTGDDIVNLKTDDLSILGTTNEIETTVTNNQIQIGLPDNVTIGNDLLVTGDLTVTGNTIENQVTNLNIEDQFILLNSGSTAQDAGIVINGQGAAFGWDESENRFALDFAGATWDQTSITSDAYVAAVVTTDDANYQKVGNIRIDTSTEDIFIYV